MEGEELGVVQLEALWAKWEVLLAAILVMVEEFEEVQLADLSERVEEFEEVQLVALLAL